ncbi:hypothetical protein B1B_01655 [mine drainage metagenome]|uniref:DUF6788 domain-containing protein n=1 Tax=mine drainage metagenome TaxID=410659 RepID=T1BU59_9ZZZZ
MGHPSDVIDRKIRKVLEELVTVGDMRPGSLSRQYNVCGNPQCRCKADPPRRHGPYYQLSWTLHGKHHTAFVRREDVAQVRQQLRAYARRQELLERWTDLSLELCQTKTSAHKA